MRLVIKKSRDGFELPLCAGTIHEVADFLGIGFLTIRQQISKGKHSPCKSNYEYVHMDDDMAEEVMTDQAIALIRLRLESEQKKAEMNKGKPNELVYRHSANVLRSILIDLEDFCKESK